ncbi:Stk1 family PASTA domain-containing Ser/Thr kinase [Papillibacter cinnamivorans]|uniref:non-specific serine/threonine protein kinase n=1 Tax=Papillibacter cinnamivorans DSM 12816 TaxID=1122930 RepID=A0A1W1YX97_9FIRM|nr:Stk1 family PASTA domain-containing Ser/Thr kinase [Papillibacter cinnamivorans]SMC40338.1 serine/threonine protein kinase [Papillibacter cinnamivorans DSM 12816]
MDNYIGQLLDNRYEILEVIGTGGMAVVYKARCHRLNRLVAVKILKSDLAQDADFRRRFHDESKAVAMLSHPNIVSVYDVSRSSSIEYIVMELIDGITLKQYMQKRGQLSWREALHFIIQITKALGHAHSRGIIHRDIKPHNIMILRDGSVKVADFGIARLTSSQNTLTQEALGSVHYISPEQARGSHVDARSDIYSAGVVLYEMITNRLPYEGDSPVSVAIQHINSVPLSPRELNPEIPEALEAITMKAMASDVEKRYPSADAMLSDLEEFRKNPSIIFDYTPADFMNKPDTGEPTQVISNSGRRKAINPRLRYSEDVEYEDLQVRRGSGRKRAVMVTAVVVVLVVIFSLWFFIFRSFFSATSELTVPELVGKRLEDVRSSDDNSEFTIVEGEPQYSDETEAGVILSQDPESGRKVKRNTEITVVVSLGPRTASMPDLVNTEYRSALIYLDNMGFDFHVTTSEAASDTITKGYVVSTQPVYGTELTKNAEIVVVVSTGPEVKMVTVPSFVGLPIETVELQLAALNLKEGTLTPVEDSSEDGTVLSQSVAATTSVPEGTAINFEISVGPAVTPSEKPVITPVTLTQTIGLPSGEGVVHVVVELDNAVVFDKTVNKNLGSIPVSLSGTGTEWMYVYFDGVLSDSREITFS